MMGPNFKEEMIKRISLIEIENPIFAADQGHNAAVKRVMSILEEDKHPKILKDKILNLSIGQCITGYEVGYAQGIDRIKNLTYGVRA